MNSTSRLPMVFSTDNRDNAQKKKIGIEDMLNGYAYLDKEKINEYAENSPKWTSEHWQDYFYHHRAEINLNDYNKEKVKDPVGSGRDRNELFRLIVHLEETGQKLELYQMDDFAAVVGYNGHRYVLPSETVTAVPLTDYSKITWDELKLLGAETGSMALPAVTGESTAAVRDKKAETEEKLQALEKEAEAIKDCTSADMADLKAQLDELQAQIEERKKKLLAELQEKQAKLEEEKEKLEKNIFILETQIYGIRCYLGEVVSFFTVRDGKPAPRETPIVIYQKIRYLDEELGKYLSLFDYGDHLKDKEQLLEVLKHRDDIADLLSPGPKSISVCKISRTGKVKGASELVANMLEDYKMFHENQLAVLIRNGEQIHISWLDNDKINVSDDNIFYRPETRSEAEDEGTVTDAWHRKIIEERRIEQEKKARKEMLSRWFFFAVLQGVLDNTGLISVPGKVSATDMTSQYIKFSLAEGWISEDRYGSFSDMLAKSEGIPLREGDVILTGMYIRRDDRGPGRAWNNNRGIGEKNRTYGASLPGRELLAVNKVIPGLIVRYEVQHCRAYIEMDPEGSVMYQYKDRCCCSCPMEGYEDQLERIERSPSYTVVRTDEVLGSEYVTETMSGNHWYGTWGVHSYRKLTDEQLADLSRISRNRVYRCDNDRSVDTTNESKKVYEEGIHLYYNKIAGAEIIGESGHQYYCSVENAASWTCGTMRVNFQFYESEVIPLPFLCGSWIKSVIMSGNIGKYRLCGSEMSYADMLPYLHKLFAHLRSREEKEKEMLTAAGGGKWLEETPDWDAVLCGWKIENRIHALTETRAKRFLKVVG